MVLLFGYGLSNKSIEKYFLKNKILYKIYDDSFNEKYDLINVDLIIKSNGISNMHQLLSDARKLNIKIMSDLDFFNLIDKNKNYILVTGSNGKTTTVNLLEQVINDSIAIGNNGLPFFDYINSIENKILEVSSFMLENSNHIKYKYNVITNLFKTHLEHHLTFSDYVKSKINVLRNLKEDDCVIFNYDDVLLRRIVQSYKIKSVSVSLHDINCDLYLKDKFIYYKNKMLVNTEKIKIKGKHNLYNIMFSLGVCMNHPCRCNDYIDKILNFTGVKNRLQLIHDGEFKVYNDSKSTNLKALHAAIDSFEEKVILIVGGKKRNDDFSILNDSINKIKKVYCYGENRYDFYNYFKAKNIECIVYHNLEEVINELIIIKNDVVLFSPGSVSYDQFHNFEERGKVFCDLIKKLSNSFK